MLENIWFAAAIWMGLAFIASLISIRIGISVALIEIIIGIIAGNFLGIHKTTEWINFLAMLGSGVLTFLAGAEIDPASLKAHLKESLLIGSFSFYYRFLECYFLLITLQDGDGSNQKLPELLYQQHPLQLFMQL